MNFTASVLMICIAILLSAFFSSTEIAYTSLNRIRLDGLAEKGKRSARLARKISNNYDCTLSSILIGNNLVNNIASSVATMMAVAIAGRGITLFGKISLTEGLASTIASICVTVAILIFGEIVPKIIAKQHSLGYACIVAYPLQIISWIFFPISYVVTKVISKVTQRVSDGTEETVTEEELSAMIETAEEEGVVDEEQGELLQSALDYQETTVEDILLPRINVTGVDIDAEPEEIRDICLSTVHSRLPVYEESLDHIIGILPVNHYLRAATEHAATPPDLRALVHEPYFVHKTAKLPNVLAEMRRRQIHMAVVMDEYGGTMGIVTMEDILEEIVGDIWDEFDSIEEEDIVPLGADTFEVDGMTPIADFFEELDLDDRGFESAYTTMGGWAVEMLEEDPHEGDSFDWRNLHVTVTEMRDNLVSGLRVTVGKEEEEE